MSQWIPITTNGKMPKAGDKVQVTYLDNNNVPKCDKIAYRSDG